VFVSGADRERL